MASFSSSVTRLDSAGRIVIPAEVRKKMGVKPGCEVVLEYEDGELKVFTVDHSIRKAQDLVCKYIPPGVSLVDELLAERREEVRLENLRARRVRAARRAS